MHFGEHLTIDGYEGLKERLDDPSLLLRIINDLVSGLDMHLLSIPQVFKAPGNQHKDPGGWSAFAVIQESHISLHTFPLRGFMSADVYTCQNDLKKDYVIKVLKEGFNLHKIETNFIIRGKSYPLENIEENL